MWHEDCSRRFFGEAHVTVWAWRLHSDPQSQRLWPQLQDCGSPVEGRVSRAGKQTLEPERPSGQPENAT